MPWTTVLPGFHSISFPSEWGVDVPAELMEMLDAPRAQVQVSIQLVSPASGELSGYAFKTAKPTLWEVSIQLVSPASGEGDAAK